MTPADRDTTSLVRRIALSFTFIAAAAIIQWVAWPQIAPSPYIGFFPALILASLYGEIFTATLLTILASQFLFIEPSGHFRFQVPGDLIRTLLLISSAVLLDTLIRRIKKAKSAADRSIRTLLEERQLRERFVSTLTHDLRNPLQGARTSIELLLARASLSSQQRLLLQRSLSGLGRADQLIQNLLDTNQIQAGRPPQLLTEELDLDELLATLAVDEYLFAQHPWTLITHGDLHGCWDRSALMRIISNLVGNAVKYGLSNGRVTIEAHRSTETTVCLSVHNDVDGHPIPEAELSRIFTEYHRLPGTQKPGWGLGLPLVKGLTEAHGGKAFATSSKKEGTTFTIELPVQRTA